MGELIHLHTRTEPWVSKLTLANWLGCSTRQVEKWGAMGMPFRRPGQKNQYRISACEAWLRENGILIDQGEAS
jgi:phage terminase Nu1 subunit (DNA packaging protein)